MMSFYNDYPSYETVAEKKARALKTLVKLQKKNPDIEPIVIEGRTIAKSWWGKAWNQNLESYADYDNRLARGKSYVRSNMVIDLKILTGVIKAKVMGSRSKPYDIEITIDPLAKNKWQRIILLCNRRIDTLEQLIEGKFPKELEVIFTERNYGLFPSPREIHFNCSCPDLASMCKHISAVLYGVGSRLDQDPMLFFKLRALDGHQLIQKTMEQKLSSMMKNAGKKSQRTIAEKDISKLFGL